MTRIAFLIALSLSLMEGICAQSFNLYPGSYWTVDWWTSTGQHSHYDYLTIPESSFDTTINVTTYFKVEVIGGEYTAACRYETSTKKLLCVPSGSTTEVQVADFDANIGDTLINMGSNVWDLHGNPLPTWVFVDTLYVQWVASDSTITAWDPTTGTQFEWNENRGGGLRGFFNTTQGGSVSGNYMNVVCYSRNDSLIYPNVIPNQTCDTTLSIEENNSIGAVISIHPNPSSGQFTLTLTSHPKEEVTITVYSLDGQELHQATFYKSAETVKLDLSSLPKGLYLLTTEVAHRFYGVNRIVLH